MKISRFNKRLSNRKQPKKVLILPLLDNYALLPTLKCIDESETIAFWCTISIKDLKKHDFTPGMCLTAYQIQFRDEKFEDVFNRNKRRSIVLSSAAICKAKSVLSSEKYLNKYVLCVGYMENTTWDAQIGITGKLNVKEKYMDGAIRELYEETGLDMKENTMIKVSDSVYTINLNV